MLDFTLSKDGFIYELSEKESWKHNRLSSHAFFYRPTISLPYRILQMCEVQFLEFLAKAD